MTNARSLRAWFRQPRTLLLLFFAVTAVPAVVLIWAGWRLNEQDRALDAQRLAERREQAADLAAALLEQSLADLESHFMSSNPFPPENMATGVHAVEINSNDVQIAPAVALPYFPELASEFEPSHRAFEPGERAEFFERDQQKAVRLFRQLANRSSGSVRAGALIRLARNLRKEGRPDEALKVYSEIQDAGDVRVDGIPAELIARRARCALLGEQGRSDQLREESRELLRLLRQGRWRIGRAVYTHFESEVAVWAGPGTRDDEYHGPLALAAAVDWLYRDWQAGDVPPDISGERISRGFEGVNQTIIWRKEPARVKALVFSDRHLPALAANAISAGKRQGLHLALRSPEGGVALSGISENVEHISTRPAAATGLPWDVLVATADVAAETRQSSARRRALTVGLALLVFFVAAGSYLIFRAYRQELAVSQLQNDFVSAVSHEFRTPLTSLRQLTENLASGRVREEERRRSYYGALSRATGRLQRLVEELLDFGRMEAGMQNYERRPLDVAEWIANLHADFEAETGGGSERLGLTCEASQNGRRMVVNADAALLGRAVWNLLENAVRYSPSGSPIDLRVAARDGLVEISVKDEGIGIPADEQEQVFRKFVRGSKSAARDVKGTGLGLAIVEHVVAAHGGKVKLISEPGKGSTFTVELPRMVDEWRES